MIRTVIATTLMVGVLAVPAVKLGQWVRTLVDQPKTSVSVAHAVVTKHVEPAHVCQATLTEAVSRMPKDLDLTFSFADLSKVPAVGQYKIGQNRVLVDENFDCAKVPHVVAHEWFHALQDDLGETWDMAHRDETELIAECAARVLSGENGWETFSSYPELQDRPCSDVSEGVEYLFSSAR